MNRKEFLLKQAESERLIGRRVIPIGIIYATRLALTVCCIILMLFLWVYFTTEARNIIFFMLGTCILFFVASFPIARDSRRQFKKLSLKCPSCQYYLVFINGKQAAETGRCPHCGVQIFDE